jgi:hypothetical protein
MSSCLSYEVEVAVEMEVEVEMVVEIVEGGRRRMEVKGNSDYFCSICTFCGLLTPQIACRA